MRKPNVIPLDDVCVGYCHHLRFDLRPLSCNAPGKIENTLAGPPRQTGPSHLVAEEMDQGIPRIWFNALADDEPFNQVRQQRDAGGHQEQQTQSKHRHLSQQALQEFDLPLVVTEHPGGPCVVEVIPLQDDPVDKPEITEANKA